VDVVERITENHPSVGFAFHPSVHPFSHLVALRWCRRFRLPDPKTLYLPFSKLNMLKPQDQPVVTVLVKQQYRRDGDQGWFYPE